MITHNKDLSWGAIIAGALLTAALFLILTAFGLALGFAVGSPAPTWRDSSFVVWFASGLYLILSAVVSSAAGAYMAGRLHPHAPDPDLEENEVRSGLRGLAVWSVAVVLGPFSLRQALALWRLWQVQREEQRHKALSAVRACWLTSLTGDSDRTVVNLKGIRRTNVLKLVESCL